MYICYNIYVISHFFFPFAGAFDRALPPLDGGGGYEGKA